MSDLHFVNAVLDGDHEHPVKSIIIDQRETDAGQVVDVYSLPSGTGEGRRYDSRTAYDLPLLDAKPDDDDKARKEVLGDRHSYAYPWQAAPSKGKGPAKDTAKTVK